MSPSRPRPSLAQCRVAPLAPPSVPYGHAPPRRPPRPRAVLLGRRPAPTAGRREPLRGGVRGTPGEPGALGLAPGTAPAAGQGDRSLSRARPPCMPIASRSADGIRRQASRRTGSWTTRSRWSTSGSLNSRSPMWSGGKCAGVRQAPRRSSFWTFRHSSLRSPSAPTHRQKTAGRLPSGRRPCRSCHDAAGPWPAPAHSYRSACIGSTLLARRAGA
jgi:hypothetical protein